MTDAMNNGQILVASATKHGSTRQVAEAVAQRLRNHGLAVEVAWAAEVDGIATRYDAVVVGGSLYTGRWHRDALRLLAREHDALQAIPVAIFALGPKTANSDDIAGSRRQLDAALAKVPHIEPVAIAVFGGKVDPKVLRFPFSRLPASDARDWTAIDEWADELAAAFGCGITASEAVDGRSELQKTPR
jgi:menaquinone-dependent protoporphyrinogen oxidase